MKIFENKLFANICSTVQENKWKKTPNILGIKILATK